MFFLLVVGLVAFVLLRPDGSTSPRRPSPAPTVRLTPEDKSVWKPGPARQEAIPALVYHGLGAPEDFSDQGDAAYGLDPYDFAKQMELMHHAGYQTVSLKTYIRFVAGKRPRLPERPFLLTFDDARADSWLGADNVLGKLGYTAVLFVDTGALDSDKPEYMTWDELEEVQRSGRWDAQLHSGRGHTNIRYGPGENDVGPYYAYRAEGESLNDWRRRAKGDVEWGIQQMKEHLPGWQLLAFAPPYGNLGQVSTNDPEIPLEAVRWLSGLFDVGFVQDRSGFARPDGRFLQGRYQLSRAISGGELHSWLESAPGAG